MVDTHLKNVSMRQSNGPKATMPNERPLGELLLALDKFNNYELYTGTGEGVQPLIADGIGTSNVSFKLDQEQASTLANKFVYFDADSKTWKPAYASISEGNHFTAQGFAIALSSTGIQITTSGKLIVPANLKDYAGTPLVKDSYYYLCQDQANAGLIQQAAPATGIKQIVCQVIDITENSTTLILLNDLNQIANDIIMTDGDGSKYLGDDGQYHNMMVASLAGRTSNCIEQYEVLDIDFQNIPAGDNSFGYIKNGDITVENNIASNFSEQNYLISKYLIENYSQFSFRIKQSFTQVQTIEPILCAPNKTNYMAVEQSKLKVVLNDRTYFGNITYQANKDYHFRLTYNSQSGYVVSMSEDGTSWTNEIILYDAFNYFNNATVYLGIVSDKDNITYTSGSIDLSMTGIDFINNAASNSTYPLSAVTTKNVATITVTFKGTGLIAAGRSNLTNTLNVLTENVDTVSNTIIASDAPDIVWDADKGLTTTNYSEVDFKSQYEDDTENSTYYAKDQNRCYKQTIIYPNFLETNVTISEETRSFEPAFKIVGNPTFDASNGNCLNFSVDNYCMYPMIFDPGNKPWKRQWYINTGTLYTNHQTQVLGSIDTHSAGVEWGFTAEKKFIFWLGSTNLAMDIANGLVSDIILADNTDYFVQIEFTGTQYIFRYSTDYGNSYTNVFVVDSTTPIAAEYQVVGVDATVNTATGFPGLVSLNNCIDWIDGKQVFRGCIDISANKGDKIVDFSAPGASFHPNTFLNRNGFNFNLKLNAKGALQVERAFNARNYGGTTDVPYNYAGVDWSTFVNDGNYTQGVKLSSQLGTNNTGTGANSLSKLTADTAEYWWCTGQTGEEPCFAYINFINPVRFETVLLRGPGSAAYTPQLFCLHVSNDMQTWHSIMPKNRTGYTENSIMGYVPIDAYATWTLTTVNGKELMQVEMPDKETYWKYFRIGVWQDTNYHAEFSGLWVGAADANPTTCRSNCRELIFEKKNFINEGSSGINASIELKKKATAYQVRFLDKLGYTNVAPENAVIDETGKKLIPNGTPVYKNTRMTNRQAVQQLAYQTRCPVYLLNNRTFGAEYAANPYQTSGYNIYSGCATTGTVANSYKLLQFTTEGYDFENGTDESGFVITFVNRARVGAMVIQNWTTVGRAPTFIKVYGSVNGGTEPGTTNPWPSDPIQGAAEWEEVPITKVYQQFGGDYDYYNNEERPNTSRPALGCSNYANGAMGSGNSGTYIFHIAPQKSYMQYKVVVQRNHGDASCIMMTIIPTDVYFDPWATDYKIGTTEHLPLLVDSHVYYPTSSATVLPSKSTMQEIIYVSQNSPELVAKLYDENQANIWDPHRNRQYALLQIGSRYPICTRGLYYLNYTDLNYAMNHIQAYGTNLDAYACDSTPGVFNNVYNWTRLTSLKDKSDTPTFVDTTTANGQLVFQTTEYGYTYTSLLISRTINNRLTLAHIRQNAVMNIGKELADQSGYNWCSYYTEEWKWTNVAGNKGDKRFAACYNHPLLQAGDTTRLEPAYEVKKIDENGNELLFYTKTEGQKDSYLPDGTAVYRTTSMIDVPTLSYENRWMYKYKDKENNIWYSNTAPTGTAGTLGSFMYKSIIPKYTGYHGIPLNATANTGSANGYTYFCSDADSDGVTAWVAFQNLADDAETWASKVGSYNATTGMPTGDEQYIGFKAPNPMCIQGYTIGTRSSYPCNPAIWEFQGSTDGQTWIMLDYRDTRVSGDNPGTDAPVNAECGTEYFFDNENSYQYYRWVIKKIQPGSSQTLARLKVWNVSVLDENPVKVQGINQLSYTDSTGAKQLAYTAQTGSTGDYIGNNITIYTDYNLQNPIQNIWAYKVTDSTNTGWTKAVGDKDAYVPETTTIYEDPEFTKEYVTALVDTWTYTGDINQKYSFDGVSFNNFEIVDKDAEPYNKYFYTGNIKNVQEYTGKIEGWTYTGVTEDIYEVEPSFKVTLKGDSSRKVSKSTMIGMAYPVTNADNLSGTNYYSFTSGDVAGTIVPSGTQLYTNVTDTTPATIADGTNTFVFSSAPAQTRYSKEYGWTVDTRKPTGASVDAGTTIYSDVDLTQEVTTDATQWTYEVDIQTPDIVEFYHKIEDKVPTSNYNLGLAFDGSKYTFTSYKDGATVDSQEFESSKLIKASYEDQSAILMRQQNYVGLNLSKTMYGWWDWNNIVSPQTTETTANIFRLGKMDGSSSDIESIEKLFPWRVGETGGTSEGTTAIGDPIFTLSNDLKKNEIWLEGQEVEIKKYKKLYKVYGTTYGGNGTTTFGLPNFKNKTVWGSEGDWGYIAAGLPKLAVDSDGAHTHTRGSMNITGSFRVTNQWPTQGYGISGTNNATSGAFSPGGQWGTNSAGNGGTGAKGFDYSFNAANSWSGATSSSGAHTHQLNLGILQETTTVQPPAICIRVKTRYK